MDFEPFFTSEHISVRLHKEAEKQILGERSHCRANSYWKSHTEAESRHRMLWSDVRNDISNPYNHGRRVPVYYYSGSLEVPEYLGRASLDFTEVSFMSLRHLLGTRHARGVWFFLKAGYFFRETEYFFGETEECYKLKLPRHYNEGIDGGEDEEERGEDKEDSDWDEEERSYMLMSPHYYNDGIDGGEDEEEGGGDEEEGGEDEEDSDGDKEESSDDEGVFEGGRDEEDSDGDKEESSGDEGVFEGGRDEEDSDGDKEESSGDEGVFEGGRDEEEGGEDEEDSDGDKEESSDDEGVFKFGDRWNYRLIAIKSTTRYISLSKRSAAKPPPRRPPPMDERKSHVNAYFLGADGLCFSTDKKIVRIVDDAYLADIAVLVLSASENDIEGQCARFEKNIKLVMERGASQLFVLVKDMSQISWSEDRFFDITVQLQNPLRRALGSSFRLGKAIKFLPISDLSDGLNERNVKPGGEKIDWWNGPCLFEALDMIGFPHRDSLYSFRMPIVAKIKNGTGTVVTGKVESGTVGQGDSLFVMPNRTQVEVLAVSVHQNEAAVNRAGPGENVQICLSGITDEDIRQGCVLSCAEDVVPALSEFGVLLKILKLPDNESFTVGYKAMLHVHTVREECVISELQEKVYIRGVNFGREEFEPDTIIENGDYIVCKLKVQNLICVEEAFNCPKLGRLIICSSEGDIIAVGDIIPTCFNRKFAYSIIG